MLTYVGESERERERDSESPSPGLQSLSDRERLLKIQPTCNLRTYKQPTRNLRRRTALSRGVLPFSSHQLGPSLHQPAAIAVHILRCFPPHFALRISAKADQNPPATK